MLFLAVFCGFLAEYKLEQTIERHREKEYMQLMIEDLKKDTANINKMVAGNRIIISGLDSLLDLLSAPQAADDYHRKLFTYSLKYTYWYMPVATFFFLINLNPPLYFNWERVSSENCIGIYQ